MEFDPTRKMSYNVTMPEDGHIHVFNRRRFLQYTAYAGAATASLISTGDTPSPERKNNPVEPHTLPDFALQKFPELKGQSVSQYLEMSDINTRVYNFVPNLTYNQSVGKEIHTFFQRYARGLGSRYYSDMNNVIHYSVVPRNPKNTIPEIVIYIPGDIFSAHRYDSRSIFGSQGGSYTHYDEDEEHPFTITFIDLINGQVSDPEYMEVAQIFNTALGMVNYSDKVEASQRALRIKSFETGTDLEIQERISNVIGAMLQARQMGLSFQGVRGWLNTTQIGRLLGQYKEFLLSESEYNDLPALGNAIKARE